MRRFASRGVALPYTAYDQHHNTHILTFTHLLAHVPDAPELAEHHVLTVDLVCRRFVRPGDNMQVDLSYRQAYAAGARCAALSSDEALHELDRHLAGPVPQGDEAIALWLTHQSNQRAAFLLGVEASRAWLPDAAVFRPGVMVVVQPSGGTLLETGV